MYNLYVLLEFYNDYDQHGGYFAGVFPTYEDAKASVDHIGRVHNEYSWYAIKEIDIGRHYGVIDEDDIDGD